MKKGILTPTFTTNIIALLAAVLILIYGVAFLGQNPHVVLLFSCSILLVYGLLIGKTWVEMRENIIKSISESIETMLIICLIGILVGVLMASGTVPTIIYYGLKILYSYWIFHTVLFCKLFLQLLQI